MGLTRPSYGPPRPAPDRDPLVRYVLRPAALAVMAACIAWPLAQVVGAVFAGTSSTLIVGAVTLAALEATYAHAILRSQYITGGLERVRFRLVEYGLYFVLIRLAVLRLAGWPPEQTAGLLLADGEALFALLLDPQTLFVFVLAVVSNLLVSDTLADLDRAEEPPIRDERTDRQAAAPVESLTGRFFMLGAVVLVLSGLARVGPREVLDLQRAPAAGLIVNVLIYFCLGLVLLGRARLAQLAGRWHLLGLRTPPDLPGRWVRYSLAFVGAAALLAFVLPTGYTSGALGVIGDLLMLVLTVAWVLAAALLGLLILPFAWLMAQLLGPRVMEPIQRAQQEIIPPADPAQVSSWLEVLRPLVIWSLVIGMVVYVFFSYLRDRPELLAALRRLAPLRALGRLWAALRHRASGLARAAEKYAPLAWLRQRLARAGPGRLGVFRLGAAAPREQVFYYYLSLVRRAGEIGLARRPAQTPREYQPRLAGELPEVEAELRALTDAFIEARYGPGPLDPAAPSRARALWSRLRAALRARKVNDARGRPGR